MILSPLPKKSVRKRWPWHWRLGWWSPGEVYEAWKPYGWLGTDEWHNPAASVVIPFLGAFHIWFSSWADETDGHFSLSPEMDAPDCPTCILFREDRDAEVSWWNPPTRGLE